MVKFFMFRTGDKENKKVPKLVLKVGKTTNR